VKELLNLPEGQEVTSNNTLINLFSPKDILLGHNGEI
jgi:hypothetical protein